MFLSQHTSATFNVISKPSERVEAVFAAQINVIVSKWAAGYHKYGFVQHKPPNMGDLYPYPVRTIRAYWPNYPSQLIIVNSSQKKEQFKLLFIKQQL